MCLNPVLVKNPNRNGISRRTDFKKFHNTTTQYDYRPCGQCSQCLQMKQMYIVQRLQMESVNSLLFFCTLTYNRKYLPIIDDFGLKLPYARYNDIRLFLQRLRDNNVLDYPFKYLIVSEHGTQKHRPHWHLMFMIDKKYFKSYNDIMDFETRKRFEVLKYWSENVGTRKNPVYECRLTYKERFNRRTYDFHYVNPALSNDGEADVAFYVTKYCLKPNDYIQKIKRLIHCKVPEEDKLRIWNLFRPKRLWSNGVGAVTSPKQHELINKGYLMAHDNSSPYPYFVNPVDGSTQPLSPYYKREFTTVEDLEKFLSNSDSEFICDDATTLTEREDIDIIKRKEDKFKAIQKRINDRDMHVDFFVDTSNWIDYDTIPEEYIEPYNTHEFDEAINNFLQGRPSAACDILPKQGTLF